MGALSSVNLTSARETIDVISMTLNGIKLIKVHGKHCLIVHLDLKKEVSSAKLRQLLEVSGRSMRRTVQLFREQMDSISQSDSGNRTEVFTRLLLGHYDYDCMDETMKH